MKDRRVATGGNLKLKVVFVNERVTVKELASKH